MILFTGRGTSGSWKIRGEQLGRACGGVVKPKASLDDCKKADLIVLVKRPTPELMENIKRSKTPWVWDIVDFYPQPACSDWGKSKSINWVKSQIARHGPNAVIWPNARMANDCRTKLKGAVIYHHHRPDIGLNPIRKDIKCVFYEGSPNYLGKWGDAVLKECKRRGWEFRINQGTHADADICVAFRDSQFNGYAQYHWKSNVKLENAKASGTPFIGPAECGYTETAAGGEVWVEDLKNIGGAFDLLECQDRRLDIRNAFLQKAYSIEQAASDLMAFVRGL